MDNRLIFLYRFIQGMEGRRRLGWLLIGLKSKDVGLIVGKSAICTAETRKALVIPRDEHEQSIPHCQEKLLSVIKNVSARTVNRHRWNGRVD